MASICPTKVPTAYEKARSIPRQRGPNTEVQGQNTASSVFQEVINLVPGHDNKNPNTSTAATENPEISGIDNSPLGGVASYLLKHSMFVLNCHFNVI